jgi:hypothetical protein
LFSFSVDQPEEPHVEVKLEGMQTDDLEVVDVNIVEVTKPAEKSVDQKREEFEALFQLGLNAMYRLVPPNSVYV